MGNKKKQFLLKKKKWQNNNCLQKRKRQRNPAISESPVVRQSLEAEPSTEAPRQCRPLSVTPPPRPSTLSTEVTPPAISASPVATQFLEGASSTEAPRQCRPLSVTPPPRPSTSSTDVTPPAISASPVATQFLEGASSTEAPRMRRHIVDGQGMINQCFHFQHHPLFDCPSGSVEILQETRKGLVTEWFVVCRCCQKRDTIQSESPDTPLETNVAAVNAAIYAGIGYAESVQFLAGMGVSLMSEGTYQKKKKTVAHSVKEKAWESMLEAGREERSIALESGNVDQFGDVCITVICDGAWSKRSYGTGYSAYSGQVCIIGANTGKVLFYGVRNRYCSLCDSAERRGLEPAEHECYRNWKGKSPNAMEADIVLEGFRESMTMHNLKYTSYIGDGDSNVAKKLHEARPYGPAVDITKIECRNHMMRVFCRRLSNAEKNTHYPLQHRRNIREITQKSLRKSITEVIDLAVKKGDVSPQNIMELKKGIEGCVLHIAGKHDKCSSSMCDGRPPLNLELLQSSLFAEIMRATARLTSNARSFIVNKTNNPCEDFNSVLNKQVGGKRVNYTQRDGYLLRVASTVVKFNSGNYLRETTKKMTHGVSPGSAAKKLHEKYLKKKIASNQQKRKRKRQLFPPSEEYGAATLEPLPGSDEALSEEELQALIQRLTMTDDERCLLEETTRDQSECAKWRDERKKRLTASNFGQVARMTKKADPKKRARQIIFGQFSSRATSYGCETEDLARNFYEEQMQITIARTGLFVGDREPYLAASPDGKIDAETLIEIKCPYNVRDTENFRSAVSKMDFLTEKGGNIGLKKNHKYYYQIQGQMALTKTKKCIFFVFTPHWQWEEVISYDDHFWQSMKPKLWSFYRDHMAPSIKDFIF